MAQNGNRRDLLTFNGVVKITRRVKIDTSSGVAVLVREYSQELSNDSDSEFLGARDESSTDNNGHFELTVA
tara:strand:- start:20814 stop:21026 length:213 start_codon:yes stop_codon:yes gene_type:complete